MSSTRTPWTYHVVMADGTDSILEVGPFSTVSDALTLAAESMGRTAHDVDVDVTARALTGTPGDSAPLAEWITLADDSDTRRLIGYTIERYDGEETDGSWGINGGLRSEILAAAA